jgi:hypothetical protein
LNFGRKHLVPRKTSLHKILAGITFAKKLTNELEEKLSNFLLGSSFPEGLHQIFLLFSLLRPNSRSDKLVYELNDAPKLVHFGIERAQLSFAPFSCFGSRKTKAWRPCGMRHVPHVTRLLRINDWRNVLTEVVTDVIDISVRKWHPPFS